MHHDLTTRAVETAEGEVYAAHHYRQHIVEVVGDAAGKLADRFHLLHLAELGFGGLALGGLGLQRLVGLPQLLRALAHRLFEHFRALGLAFDLAPRRRILAKRLDRDDSEEDRAQTDENSKPAQDVGELVRLVREDHAAGMNPTSLARAIALLLPLALLGGALGSQYLGGLHPCEMCYWQRWPHGAAIVLAALAFTAPAQSQRSRTLTLLAALAIAISGAIGVYHAGVEAKIFEGFTTCTANATGASTAELLKQITHAPLVRCDQVQFRFLGISMAGWNAILSLGGAALILLLGLKPRRAA